MECEQRGLYEHEMALLKGLECAAGSHVLEIGFEAAAKRVAATRLAKTNEMKLPNSQWGPGINHEAGNVTFACMRFKRGGKGLLPPLHPWPGQNTIALHAALN